MTATATTIPSTITGNLIRGRLAVEFLLIAGASLFIAIAAQIAIPVPASPVPLTMQPLAVLLVGITLGATRGAAAATLYLIEGLNGLPVFAQGHGGAAWLIGPTAGYLFSYPFAAFIAGWFSERGWGSHRARAIVGMSIALGVIYLGGWSWLAAIVGPAAAFSSGIVPFVIADLLKVALAAALLPQVQRLVQRLTQ